MLLNDRQIRELCKDENGMLWPFEPTQKGKPSYGLGSFGYDLRLDRKILVPLFFRNTENTNEPVLDPLANNTGFFQEYTINGEFYDIQPGTFILGMSVERFKMPDNILGVVDGKSTYARLGILVNVTSIEPQWFGRLVMEIANVGIMPVRLYVEKGICQVSFYSGDRPERTYTEKESGGIYQGQTGLTLPR